MSNITPPPPATEPFPGGLVPPMPPAAATPPQRPRLRWITPTLAIVAALAIGLFGGILIGHNTSASAQGPSGNFAARGGGQAGGNFARSAGGNFTSGTIVSINDGTIVIKTRAGNETVTTTSSTRVSKTSKSSISALKTGQTVTVVGTKDSSGNLTASSVSEGAGGLRGGLGGGRVGGGTSTPAP
ncbi:MAG: DUF5666 domain-containing protein [Terrimesophilobacter sp.]